MDDCFSNRTFEFESARTQKLGRTVRPGSAEGPEASIYGAYDLAYLPKP